VTPAEDLKSAEKKDSGVDLLDALSTVRCLTVPSSIPSTTHAIFFYVGSTQSRIQSPVPAAPSTADKLDVSLLRFYFPLGNPSAPRRSPDGVTPAKDLDEMLVRFVCVIPILPLSPLYRCMSLI
jgi:hypothetical protein